MRKVYIEYMMKNSNMNMTEGSPVKLLVLFAVPMMIGNIFQQFYNLVDSIIVGRLVGASALAAIGATGSITFLFFALCNGIGTGGGIITSHFFGSGEKKQVKSCIANVGYIMLVFPIVVGIIALLSAKPLLLVLQTPDDIFADSLAYTRLMCFGLLFVSLYNYVSAMLRALGDSRTPLYFLIFSCILNTILDIIFVRFLHMGVVGAGIATLISQFLSGVLCLWYAIARNDYFALSRDDFLFNREIVIRAVKIGIPLSLQYALIAISCMALQFVVNGFGPVTLAAFTAISRIEQVIHQPYQTLGAALSTYVGQNYGARKSKRIIEGYHKCFLLMVVFTILMLPIMQLFGRQITAIFVDDVEVIEMGAQALKISSWFYVFLGVIYVIRSVLTGIGDAFFPLLNGIVEVLGRFLLPVPLTSIPALGVWGIWWSVGLVWFFSGFTAWLRYLQIKRRRIDSLESDQLKV